MPSSRELARKQCEHAVGFMAQAFNLCENVDIPYRYSDDVRARVMEILREIVFLTEKGKIIERKAAMAQQDTDFQKFVARLQPK